MSPPPWLVSVVVALFASRAAAAGCAALYSQCGGIGWTGATCCATGSSCQYANDYYYQCLPYVGNSACAATYGQCGGIGWTGPTCCQSDWVCLYNNDYYYQCLPPADTATPTPTPTPTQTQAPCATNWGQCGGVGWTGATCCQDDWPCVYGNEYYWQCISPSSASALSSTPSSSTTPPPPNTTLTTTTATATSTPTTLSTTITAATTTGTMPISTTTTTTPVASTTLTTTVQTSSTTRSTSATSSPTGPRVLYGGVNIAGFDFGSYDTCGVHTAAPYVNPSNYIAQIAHFVDDDGLNAFRLPVSWQYLINQYDGGALGANQLDPGNAGTFDTLVQGCLNAGADLCIIDVHNYGRFNGKIIGQDGPSAAQFAALWSQIATKYASQSQVAFGLMNEPHDESCSSPNGGVMDITTWAATLQTVVNAIRQAGATSQYIILPGKGWTHSLTYLPANSDGSGPALMGITDPAGGTAKLVFEVHEYLDANDAGGNSDCVTNNIDSTYYRGGLANLATYLRANGRVALLTETGGLNNANCAAYLCQELSYLQNNTDVFLGYTSWAAGGFDQSYELTETPTQSGNSWTDTLIVQSCVAKCFTGAC